MIVLLEDMNMDDASEEVAVEIAAQGVLRKRVDEMEAGFMMALDYMKQLADSDQDNGNSACSSRSKTACKTCLVREEAWNIMGDGYWAREMIVDLTLFQNLR